MPSAEIGSRVMSKSKLENLIRAAVICSLVQPLQRQGIILQSTTGCHRGIYKVSCWHQGGSGQLKGRWKGRAEKDFRPEFIS